MRPTRWAAHLTLEDLASERFLGTTFMTHELLPSDEEMISSKHYWRVFAENDGFRTRGSNQCVER